MKKGFAKILMIFVLAAVLPVLAGCQKAQSDNDSFAGLLSLEGDTLAEKTIEVDAREKIISN